MLLTLKPCDGCLHWWCLHVPLRTETWLVATTTDDFSLTFSHRTHFHSCCSAFDQLGAVAAQMPGVEQLFTPTTCVGGADSRPAIAQSLQYVRGQVEAAITEFTTWKTQLLCLGNQNAGESTEQRFHHPFRCSNNKSCSWIGT